MMNKLLLSFTFFSLFSISHSYAQCGTVNTAAVFITCSEINSNITLSGSVTINVNVDLSGIIIDLNKNDLTFTGTVMVDRDTRILNTNNGNPTLTVNGIEVRKNTNPVDFDELNDRLDDEGTNYSTLLEAVTGILPIELSHFIGKANRQQNTLQWMTLSETNNEWFEIEHSKDAKDFVTIAELAGAGTIDEPQHYQFAHRDIDSKVNYYRLKQIDYDGHFSYSSVIVVKTPMDNQVLIYPNVIKDDIQYELNKALSSSLHLRIINQHGQVLYQEDLPAQQEVGQINVSFLPKGYYFLQILDQTEMHYTKFIKS